MKWAPLGHLTPLSQRAAARGNSVVFVGIVMWTSAQTAAFAPASGRCYTEFLVGVEGWSSGQWQRAVNPSTFGSTQVRILPPPLSLLLGMGVPILKDRPSEQERC